MTTATPEQRHLAALIDGEPDPGGFERAIEAIARDAALRARFERGLLIGRALRGETSSLAARTIGARVSAALASEPVRMRPDRSRPPLRPAPARWRPDWSSNQGASNRPAAALAIAASLVAVAILVVPGLIGGPSGGPNRDAPSRAQPAPALTEINAIAQAWMVEPRTLDEPAESRVLSALLVDHRERASASGLTGFIPYAAVVGQSGLR